MARRTPRAAEPWRAHLTDDEIRIIARAEAAKEAWRLLKHQRALAISRACRRAKAAAEITYQQEA